MAGLGVSMRLAIAGVCLVCFANVASAATFTVTNTNDSGAGSLRAALAAANAAAGADTIAFAISGSPPFTIALATAST